MAFCNKVGSILRQSISLSSATSMMNSMRCMYSTKLFVGGLSFGTDDGSLKSAFDGFGDVVDAKVITDRDTGRSRGFGFVNFADSESASSAISAMDGQELNGRNIRVSIANDRPPAPRGQFGGGGYRGGSGYGDGGGGGYRGDSGYGGDNRRSSNYGANEDF